MALRIKATLTGDPVSRQIDASRDQLTRAVSAAVAGATEGVKLELRQQLAAGGKFDRFRKAIQSRVYPRPPKASMSAAGTVYAAGDAAERAFAGFAAGAVVMPTRARALAIPLHGYRGADGKLLGPRSSFFVGRLKFIPARMRAAGTVGVLATRAAGRPGEIRRQLRTKGRAKVAEGLVGEWIPQFLLVKSARLPKLLSPDQAVAKWAGAMPDLVGQALAVMRS